jgi:hypothetical protein
MMIGGIMDNSNLCQSPTAKAIKDPASDVISVEECKQYLNRFELSDEKILEIRNYLIGIVDKSINMYLDDFRSQKWKQ